MSPSSPHPPSATSNSSPALPVSKNQSALVSLILGLLALPLTYGAVSQGIFGPFGLAGGLTAVAAVACGHVALAQAKRYLPGHTRRGLAIAGLVLGYLALVAMVAFIALLFVAFFTLG